MTNLLEYDLPNDSLWEGLLSPFRRSAALPRKVNSLPEPQTVGVLVWMEARSWDVGNRALSTSPHRLSIPVLIMVIKIRMGG